MQAQPDTSLGFVGTFPPTQCGLATVTASLVLRLLDEAVAAGKPTVATGFPHAVELLATGACRVVPHGDARAMGPAVRSIPTRPLEAAAMQAAARRLSGDLMWSSVGDGFDQLITTLLPQAVSAVA